MISTVKFNELESYESTLEREVRFWVIEIENWEFWVLFAIEEKGEEEWVFMREALTLINGLT